MTDPEPLDAIVLTVERSRLVTANQRATHPAQLASRAAALRDAMRYVAHRFPPRDRALVVVHVTYPDTSRRRDSANLAPTLKAMLDGLVTAGVFVDDDSVHVQGPLPIIGPPDPSLSVPMGRQRVQYVRLEWVFHSWRDFDHPIRVYREERIG